MGKAGRGAPRISEYREALLMTTDSNRELSAMTGARQTMSSWARVIESPEGVPEAFRSVFDAALGREHPFPYTVFAPAIAGFRQRTTEKLLCAVHDTIYIWERRGSQITLAAYPAATISDVELGEILLFSWLTIGGVTQTGSAAATTVEFNTVTGRHFAPFMKMLRPPPVDQDPADRDAELAKFDHLATESFKFRSFACTSLLPGEQVRQVVWQPKMSAPLARFWKFIVYRTLALAHLAILTDKEFIVIQDDARSSENRGARYGGKWRYVALPRISAAALSEQADEGITLSLTLAPGGRQLDLLFAATRAGEVARLRDALAPP